MKQIYSGNIENLSSVVKKINSGRKFRFFPNNEITKADKLLISGMFCKGIGRIGKQNDFLTVVLKVRLRRQFAFIGIFVLIFLSAFIWGEHVTINGDSDPTIWKKIGFITLGLAFFSIPTVLLLKLRADFEKKIIDKIKKHSC